MSRLWLGSDLIRYLCFHTAGSASSNVTNTFTSALRVLLKGFWMLGICHIIEQDTVMIFLLNCRVKCSHSASLKRLKTNLIHGQLDLSSERHQGTDNSQDPEQEEEHGGATASYSFQLDDAQGQDLERDKHSGTGRLNLRNHMQFLQQKRGGNFTPELESREPKLQSVMPRFMNSQTWNTWFPSMNSFLTQTNEPWITVTISSKLQTKLFSFCGAF